MNDIEKVYRYGAYQDRTEYEIRIKAKALGIAGERLEQLIEQLKEESFIDDVRFAQNYVRSKLTHGRWGVIKIKGGLFAKGVNPKIIDEVVETIDEEYYYQNMRHEMDKWMQSKPLTEENRDKLIRFLLGKGYQFGEIIKMLNRDGD